MKLPNDLDQRVAEAFCGMIERDQEIDPDSGVKALALLLAVNHHALDPAQLRHDFGYTDCLCARDMVRLARRQ